MRIKYKISERLTVALFSALLIFAATIFTAAQAKIIFESDRDGINNIYRMDVDGSNAVRLVNSDFYDSFQSASADGNKITFMRKTSPGNRDIGLVNGDGTNFRQLTISTADDTQPSINHAGTKIVFTSTRDGNREIYIMNADGLISRNLKICN